MKPFVREQMLDKQVETLEELSRRIQKIPDELILPDSVECITCHMLVHALNTFEYPTLLTVYDGWFRYGFSHSWFVDGRFAIYDPYPVGIFPASGFVPLFVAPEVAHHSLLYENVEQRKSRFEYEREKGNDAIFCHPDKVVSPYVITSDFVETVRILVKTMS